MNEGLKNCPFCDGEPQPLSSGRVRCMRCGEVATHGNWNTRPLERALSHQVAVKTGELLVVCEERDALAAENETLRASLKQCEEWQRMRQE